ncbi:heavy-metal-associated domain-containing protein [Flavobacteriaceae bacterium]|nr:heavy-metal-associated domain-containing protein [Flavobacteriaceae bacterium]
MKSTFKILFSLAIGFFIGYFVGGYIPTDQVENVDQKEVEAIVELMGTETSFAVKGNCKMCKKTIETAALSMEGVLNADWDVKTKQINLVYDDQFIELTTIHNAIAQSGYSTDLVDLNQEAYDNLPMCCQYDPEK